TPLLHMPSMLRGGRILQLVSDSHRGTTFALLSATLVMSKPFLHGIYQEKQANILKFLGQVSRCWFSHHLYSQPSINRAYRKLCRPNLHRSRFQVRSCHHCSSSL